MGFPDTVAAGNAAQNPDMKGFAIQRVELAEDALTAYDAGQVIYLGPTTTLGGAEAYDFAAEVISDGSTPFLTVDMSTIAPGTYHYIRTSVSYLLFDVVFNLLNVPFMGNVTGQKGRLASFVGENTYITTVSPISLSVTVNANKLQGFWVFETDLSGPMANYNTIHSGDAPGITVVNPISSTSPVPAGSCVVTGELIPPLVVKSPQLDDVHILLSYSVNNSYEWNDNMVVNGEWDVDVAGITEQIVDMGVRGLQAFVTVTPISGSSTSATSGSNMAVMPSNILTGGICFSWILMLVYFLNK